MKLYLGWGIIVIGTAFLISGFLSFWRLAVVGNSALLTSGIASLVLGLLVIFWGRGLLKKAKE